MPAIARRLLRVWANFFAYRQNSGNYFWRVVALVLKAPRYMKTLIAIACLLTGSIYAAPYSDTIPIPLRDIGTPTWCTTGLRGKLSTWGLTFQSVFGGQWSLTGSRRYFTHRTKESFTGTVSDRTINGTFTLADFEWTSDGFKACEYESEGIEEFATDFTVTIANGIVNGTATFPPEYE